MLFPALFRALRRCALPLLCALLAPASLRAQAPPTLSTEARTMLASALKTMEEVGYYAARVDWPAVRARAYAQAARAQTATDTYPAIREALAALGDGHSFLLTNETQAGLGAAPESEAPRFVLPEGRVLDGDARGPIGYVRVPFFMGADPGRFADSLLAVVRRVDAAEPQGWIVDVRAMGGGNIWPMLAGLGPILGDGPAGGFVNRDGSRETILVTGTAARVATPDTVATVVRTSTPYTLARPYPRVAVLTDGGTGSSAEGVALAFEGRPGARRFGTATVGASSSNEGTPMPDGSVLVVTTGLMLDRAGRAYGVPVVPDEVVEGDALEAARGWVLGAAPRD